MLEAELLSSLIGVIYDATLDASQWPRAIRLATEYVGGSGAALFSKNTVNRSSSFFHQYGHSQQAMDDYFQTYMRLDPTTVGQFMYDVGEIYSTGDLLPYEEFEQTRFYREWARPQGWVDHVASTLEKTATSFSMFAVVRNVKEGLVDGEVRRRMALVVPHIRRAVLIGNVIDLHKSEAAAFSDGFDQISAAVFFLGDSGHIAFANAAAKELLREEEILCDRKGDFTVIDSDTHRIVLNALTKASSGDEGMGAKGIALPISARDGERWLLHMLPLTSGARKKAGHTYSATAAVFVRKASMNAPSPMETVAKLYKLTPSELRVLGAVVEEVGGVPALAETLGISEATVKTHLQNLFRKSGVRRQIDLVKLVSGLATSLVS